MNDPPEIWPVVGRILVVTTVLACAVTVLHASPVLAQIGEGVAEDNLPLLEMERPWGEWLCAFVFGAAALAVGFMPSKRSHEE